MNNPVCDSNILALNNILSDIYDLAEVIRNPHMDIETLVIAEKDLFEKYSELENIKPTLKKQFEDYFEYCKVNNVPVFLNYYRIYKEL